MGFCNWSCCFFHVFFAEIERLQIFKNILKIELSLVTAWSAFIFSVENLGFPLDFPADIFWGQWLRVKAVGGLLWSDAASLIGPAAHSSTQHTANSTQHSLNAAQQWLNIMNITQCYSGHDIHKALCMWYKAPNILPQCMMHRNRKGDSRLQHSRVQYGGILHIYTLFQLFEAGRMQCCLN